MLKVLGLLTESDAKRLDRTVVGDEVVRQGGERRLWERMMEAYGDLRRVQECIVNTKAGKTYEELSATLNMPRQRLSPIANWLISLGHVQRTDRHPFVFSGAKCHVEDKDRTSAKVLKV